MSFADQWVLMTSEAFKGRVTMAALQAARQIAGEPEGTPNHELRARFARAIINNPGSYAFYFLPDIASNVAISTAGPTASLDGDLSFVISGSWDDLALYVLGP